MRGRDRENVLERMAEGEEETERKRERERERDKERERERMRGSKSKGDMYDGRPRIASRHAPAKTSPDANDSVSKYNLRCMACSLHLSSQLPTSLASDLTQALHACAVKPRSLLRSSSAAAAAVAAVTAAAAAVLGTSTVDTAMHTAFAMPDDETFT